MSDFPATVTVHWPSGPVSACDEHASGLVKLAEFLDSPVAVTVGAKGECANCRNEHDAEPEVKGEGRVPWDSADHQFDERGVGDG